MKSRLYPSRARPDAWLSSVLSGRVSQAADAAPPHRDAPELGGRFPSEITDILDLVNRLRVRLEQERTTKDALLAAVRAVVRDGSHAGQCRFCGHADGTPHEATCPILLVTVALAHAEGTA